MEAILSPLSKISKFLIAIPSAIFGIFHFVMAEGMASMVPLPGGVIWVYLTGVALVAAAVAIIIGKKARMAATLLGLMILLFALILHLPGAINGTNENAMPSMLKDLMIAGGLFLYASTLPVE